MHTHKLIAHERTRKSHNMHKSSSAPSSRPVHHHRGTGPAAVSNSSPASIAAAAAAAAANLPFSIDHILSSGSAGAMPSSIKQAMSSYQDQNLNHAHHPHNQRQQFQLGQLSQQQQQAAAMFMLNQAANPIGQHQHVGAGVLHSTPHQVDLMSSAALLNEQLALLSAAQQQQQQRNHLLDPTALAAAAAQQQLQQQWQQQQLMAVAAAMSQQQQHQASSSPLSALNGLNGPTGTNANATPNHLLSCFMASMLLQQQQKQAYQLPGLDQHQHNLNQQQHLILSQHAQATGANGFLSPLEQHQQQSKQANQLLSAHLAAAAAAAAAAANASSTINNSNYHRRSPSSNLSSASSNNTNSPVKQLFGTSANSHPLTHDQNQRKNSPDAFDRQRSPQSSSVGGGVSGAKSKANLSSSSPAALPHQQQQSNKRPTSEAETNRESRAKQVSNEISDLGVGTALSSLSNFVSNSSLFGLDDDLPHHQPKSNSSARGPSSGHKRGQQNDSGSESPALRPIQNDEDKSPSASTTATPRNPASNGCAQAGILEAVSSVLLKGASATVATTINTTLAKAPPELVQKQPAWVFCTRYSDRPSSGPRTRRAKSKDKKPKEASKLSADEKRPRTAFTSEQLEKLREEFSANSYLDEKRRKSLAQRLCLNENQIKIWFQNKRAKMKKQSNQPNPLRGLLVAGGLYNHSTATSDCSESYANGLADDVGNRAMRDFEPDDGDADEVGDEEDGQAGAGQVESGAAKSDDNKSPASDHLGSRAPIGGSANTEQQRLKRRRTSQSDGDDEDEAGGANQHTKRAKLNHMERNIKQACGQPLGSPSSSRGSSPAEQEPAQVQAQVQARLQGPEDTSVQEEESVISVS